MACIIINHHCLESAENIVARQILLRLKLVRQIYCCFTRKHKHDKEKTAQARLSRSVDLSWAASAQLVTWAALIGAAVVSVADVRGGSSGATGWNGIVGSWASATEVHDQATIS